MSLRLFEVTETIMIETFFHQINPIRENWIKRLMFYFVEKSDY